MNIRKYVNKGLRSLALALLASVSAHASSGDQDRLEQRDWHDARSLDTLDAYERYLELHPLGPNAAEAFRRAMSSAPTIHPVQAAAPDAFDKERKLVIWPLAVLEGCPALPTVDARREGSR